MTYQLVVALGCHVTLPPKKRLLTSYSFDKLANRGFRFIFKNVSAANSLFETCSIRNRFFSSPSHGGKGKESQIIAKNQKKSEDEEAFHLASSKCKIEDLNDYQKLAYSEKCRRGGRYLRYFAHRIWKIFNESEKWAHRHTRLLRFVAFVHLPFSFRSLYLFGCMLQSCS